MPEGRKKFFLGFLLWILIGVSYFIFTVDWLLPNQLGGFNYTDAQGVAVSVPGWKEAYFGAGGKASFVQESFSNTGVTVARGLTSLLIGVIVTKFSHKFTTLGSLILLGFGGFFAAFSPNYWVYLIARFFMAIGGTTLIVLLQPIISRFFTKSQRPYFSQLSPMFFPLAGLVVFALMASTSLKHFLTLHYQATIAIISAITFPLIILYWILGKNFDIISQSDVEENVVLKPATYGGIIKEPKTWVWMFAYGCWLIAYVVFLSTIPTVMKAWNPQLHSYYSGSWTGTFGLMIFIGSMAGFLGGFWNKTKLPRKPYLYLMVATFFVALILVIAAGVNSNTHSAYITSLFGGFLIGLASIGTQTVMLNIPHEYSGNSPKRMQIFMGYIWGAGYLFYTLIDFLINLLLDGYAKTKSVELQFPAGPIGLLIGIFILFLVLVFFIDESKKCGCLFKKFKKGSPQKLELEAKKQ